MLSVNEILTKIFLEGERQAVVVVGSFLGDVGKIGDQVFPAASLNSEVLKVAFEVMSAHRFGEVGINRRKKSPERFGA